MEPDSRSVTEAQPPAARLKVLIVAPSLDILGGQAVQAARLVERLKLEPELEVEFLAVNPRLPGVLKQLQKIKYVRTLVTELVYIVSLIAYVPRFDLIHAFSASYLSFILAPAPAILIAKLFRKKIVLNYRSGEAEDHLTRWRASTRYFISMVDEVAVPSEFLVELFGRFGFHARPIFNFVDTSLFKFRLREPLRPVFLSNRNFEPHYNVACVLRAFSIIQEKFADAELIVAGDGPQREDLQALAKTLALPNLRFVGLVPQEKMAVLYDAADVYLNCSDIDNMPGSIIEAFASGLLVVSTEAGGIPYIVGHGRTGLLVRCGDHQGIADEAVRMLENPALAAAIRDAAHQECQKYKWANVRDEWLRLYFELCSKSADRESVTKPVSEPSIRNRSYP